MSERIAAFCELLLLALVRVLLPARGRHRATPAQPPGRELPLTPASDAGGRADRPHDDNTCAVWPFECDTRLVRPYLLTEEERRERRLQRQPRRALWLAVHGIDVGPRRIHGMEVSV